ncbi:MAG TPA: hypothetical protein PLV52_02390 [Candidatus Omnitrophota bacterium]|nr:hypothetical protein [Candidatus Omnitrophota bacterium]
MKYNLSKNWAATFQALTQKPAILLPFFIIAFMEGIALELIYFSARKPLAIIASPIVRKFFGESYVHYPGNLVLLPKLFFYAQIVIYIFVSVFLMSIAIQIYKNTRMSLPVVTGALVKNSLKRYAALFVYAVIVIGLILAMQKLDVLVFSKISRLVMKYIPALSNTLAPTIFALGSVVFLFVSHILIYTFLLPTLAFIIVNGKPLWKAIWSSLCFGIRNFSTVFLLIFMPFLFYLPLSIVKSLSLTIMDKTFPEINLYISTLSILISAFVDCFFVIAVTQFVLDRSDLETKKR